MRSVKWYMRFVVLLGAGCLANFLWRIFAVRQMPWTKDEVATWVALGVLCWVCYCLPLYVREDCTVDLSFISVLASVLILGPEATGILSGAAYLASVSPSPDGKQHSHVLNTAPIKTLFNIANRLISCQAGGVVYYLLGGRPRNITLPGVLPAAASFIIVSIFANVAVIILYYMISEGTKPFPMALHMFTGLLPSIACSAPIGYFLALLLEMEKGAWLTMLFMLPLLLARYSFKLYLDAQRQQHNIVKAFASVLDAKDAYTQGHSSRVAFYVVKIAQAMKLPPKRVQILADAALFHDIGKIGVPDAVLQKPAPLDPQERAVIQRHAQIGVDILSHLDTYEDIIPLILHHHEFYDGSGYPLGTTGDAVPIDVYILGVADAYDAMTSDRPYRKGMPPAKAAEIIRAEAGRQFHPEVAQITADMILFGELPVQSELAACQGVAV